MAKVNFNQSFTYSNVGTVVGQLVYAKPLNRKDGSQYGIDFLINVKGHGGVNVKVPNVNKANAILEKFPVSEKPLVQFNLSALDTYLSKTGKWYLSFTTFTEAKEPKNPEDQKAIGKLGGEVTKVQFDENGDVRLLLAVYNTDNDGNLIKNKRTGEPLPVKAVPLVVKDDELKKQLKKDNIVEGANISVGYSFINKNDVGVDEFGLPTGTGKRITEIRVKKIITHYAPKPIAPENPFADEGLVEDPFIDDGVEVADPFADSFDNMDFPF